MNNTVFYLSYFLESNGFLFPQELPKNYYAPGLFLIEPSDNGEYAYSYSFDAMDNGQRVSLQLVRADEGDPYSTLCVVRTQHYGSFWFNIVRINPSVKYVGNYNELNDHNSFSLVETVNSDKLERTCKKYNFYFIGSTLRENES